MEEESGQLPKELLSTDNPYSSAVISRLSPPPPTALPNLRTPEPLSGLGEVVKNPATTEMYKNVFLDIYVCNFYFIIITNKVQ